MRLQATNCFFISRRLHLDDPVPLEVIQVDEGATVEPAKKMTPSKKQLATKVKKATPTKPRN
jgi:hypothetical protein